LIIAPLNQRFSGGLKPVYSSASRTEFNSEFWLLTSEFCLLKMNSTLSLVSKRWS
jgi:hypothetical protein